MKLVKLPRVVILIIIVQDSLLSGISKQIKHLNNVTDPFGGKNI